MGEALMDRFMFKVVWNGDEDECWTWEAAKMERRNAHSLKTHCKHGHPFDEANTRVRATGARQCRACDNARSVARHAKKRKEP